jgi:sigma54-dependent transcription regulator
MTKQHPITPPPELVQQWRAAASNVPARLSTETEPRRDYIDFIAAQAAQWGADQELEACCNYLAKAGLTGDACGLALTRRPEPPSLKKQALTMLLHLEDAAQDFMDTTQATTIIRRALETLDD